MPRHRDHDLLRALGARLKALREPGGWTQEALAEAIDVQPATLSRFEGGQGGLSISSLKRAADALGVALAELLAVGEPPAPDEQEATLLQVWRGLDAARRDLALRLLREVGKG